MSLKSLLIKFAKKKIQENRILEKWYGIRTETKEFYGQFGEDASLQTFFSNQAWNSGVNPINLEQGFYVDIGCYSPIRISNTHWFYKRGWKGINVDLSTETILAFTKARPSDINLVAAITNQEEVANANFFEFGLSSVYNTLDKESAKETERLHGIKPVKRQIQAFGLKVLFEKYLPIDQKISFLSIDAEGHDLEILKSNNWEKFRPKAIIVEVREPNFHRLMNHDVVLF